MSTSSSMARRVRMDPGQFGPWALVTGASSGIGWEFARQIAASGIHVVLVARREQLLQELGARLTSDFGVQHRAVAVDLSEGGILATLEEKTADLDVGLVVSNAGAAHAGEFLEADRREMERRLRLNTLAHLDIAHHFGQRLAARGRGGLVLVGAMGGSKGIPWMASDSASKAYVVSFAQALHAEWKPHGVHVTALLPSATETPALADLGLTPEQMPMKPMKPEQCADEGLKALRANVPVIIPGRLNRTMNALVPDSVVRNMMGKMFSKSRTSKWTSPSV
jgi:uncharacterized protein